MSFRSSSKPKKEKAPKPKKEPKVKKEKAPKPKKERRQKKNQETSETEKPQIQRVSRPRTSYTPDIYTLILLITWLVLIAASVLAYLDLNSYK